MNEGDLRNEHQQLKKPIYGGYQDQGSYEISAPEALRAVKKKPVQRKTRQSVCRLRRQTALGLDVGQRSKERKGELASDNHQRHDPDAA
jgi:hypothetical protein